MCSRKCAPSGPGLKRRPRTLKCRPTRRAPDPRSSVLFEDPGNVAWWAHRHAGQMGLLGGRPGSRRVLQHCFGGRQEHWVGGFEALALSEHIWNRTARSGRLETDFAFLLGFGSARCEGDLGPRCCLSMLRTGWRGRRGASPRTSGGSSDGRSRCSRTRRRDVRQLPPQPRRRCRCRPSSRSPPMPALAAAPVR